MTAFLRRHRAMFAIVGVAGLFLAAVGAFDTDGIAAPRRYGYWLAVMLAGGVIAAGVTELFGRRGWFESSLLLQGAAISLAISLPQTAVVWLFTGLLLDQAFDPARLVPLFPAVVIISAAVTALNILADRRPPETHAAAAGAPEPRFLDRLPPKLRGAELHAVEAEDHYLRLHTSRGSDLILLRLSDAVSELEGLEGAQTHRSWWVAKDAVLEARRSDGRAMLRLKGDVEAPVSRTYSRALREAGWF